MGPIKTWLNFVGRVSNFPKSVIGGFPESNLVRSCWMMSCVVRLDFITTHSLSLSISKKKMSLQGPQLQKLFLCCNNKANNIFKNNKKVVVKSRVSRCCSAIAIDAPSDMVTGIKWGSTKLQGARDEMEDDVAIVRCEEFSGGFYYAAVFDGHAGNSSVKFLRDELFKECIAALQGGLLLNGKDFINIKKALQEAFETTDAKLLKRLDEGGDDESGSTATIAFTGNERMYVAHVGDSNLVLSRSGKAEVLTSPHRPYGRNRSSLEEIKRIREAGGWIVDGRICGDIAVARAFGDMRFKTKKNEMLKKGLKEGRWTEKFISRIQFKGDLVTVTPDVFQVTFGSDSEFIILASDGLWDYINSLDAVNFVRNQLRQHGDVQLACEALGQLALDRRSQDNVSILIADLGRTDWRNLPLEQGNVVFELGQAFATVGIVSLAIWFSSFYTF